jgi:GLPGLI family protein
MVRNSLIFFVLLFFFHPLLGQTTYKFPLEISYDMYISFGNRELNKAELYCSDNASMYTYRPVKDYSHTDINGEENSEISFYNADTIPCSIWQDRNLNNVSQFTTTLKKKICIVEPIDTIAWQISNDVKNINSYRCNKATCHFHGRNYTAWFTLDIPCQWGPYKLQGLPGAILEAYDDRNEVSFYATKVVIKDTLIARPSIKDYEVMSFHDYCNKCRTATSEMFKKLASRSEDGFKIKVSEVKISSIEIDEE